VNKAIRYFNGWLLNPKLRYLTYAWTTNSSQGLSAESCSRATSNTRSRSRATLGFGIQSLPGTRTTSGTFPVWLAVDNRVIADEFFRPSYSTGLWLKGALARQFYYQLMLANNLSQLGVDAGPRQRTQHVQRRAALGARRRVRAGGSATSITTSAWSRASASTTDSDEDRQSQPGTEAPDNAQIRLADGNLVFTPGLFGVGINVEVAYHMAAIDGGIMARDRAGR
jgi:hypothetical protein